MFIMTFASRLTSQSSENTAPSLLSTIVSLALVRLAVASATFRTSFDYETTSVRATQASL